MTKIILIISCLVLLALFNQCHSELPNITKIKDDLVNQDLLRFSKALKLASGKTNTIKILDQAKTENFLTYDVEILTMHQTVSTKLKPLCLRVLVAYENINDRWQYSKHKIIKVYNQHE